MAKRAAILPSWVQTVGVMRDNDTRVRAFYSSCNIWIDVDIAALAGRVGDAYSLIDRRSRCRLTPTCTGWVRFLYCHGVYRPLWTDEAVTRWLTPSSLPF
jgi:hypothetical protein